MASKISNANKAKLNKMNRAAKDATLGTVVQDLQSYVGVSGSILVTTAMMSASRVPIIDANCTKGKMWQYVRSGSPLTTVKELVWTPASGCLILSATDLESGSILPNDQVYYMMW
jgi:hypothetical protein